MARPVSCGPMPIARLIQAFPKLALIFFVIHFTVIIYTIFVPSKPAVKSSNDMPPGVSDQTQQHSAERIQRLHMNENVNLSLNKNEIQKKNRTRSALLQKLDYHKADPHSNQHEDHYGNQKAANHRFPKR